MSYERTRVIFLDCHTHMRPMVLEYAHQHLPHFYDPNVGKSTIHGAYGI